MSNSHPTGHVLAPPLPRFSKGGESPATSCDTAVMTRVWQPWISSSQYQKVANNYKCSNSYKTMNICGINVWFFFWCGGGDWFTSSRHNPDELSWEVETVQISDMSNTYSYNTNLNSHFLLWIISFFLWSNWRAAASLKRSDISGCSSKKGKSLFQRQTW